MMSSKIDRIVNSAELFEQFSTFGTVEEASKFLANKGVSSIGELEESDQHRYFAIKSAPPGTRWQDVKVPVAETTSQPNNQPPPSPPLPKQPVKPTWKSERTKGWIPDGMLIDPEIQKALIKLYPESAAWVKVDGIMGPNTRGALNRYKADYHDSRLIDDPEFQQDLIRKSTIAGPLRATMPTSFAALEEQIEQFEIAATRL